MNLLVDCHCFDSELSQGITTYIKGLYSIMPSISKDIDFYFVSAKIEKIKAIFGEGDNIHYVPLTSKSRLYRLFLEIPQIIRKNKIDVAHFQYVSPLIKNCKTIVTLHDILFVDYPQYFPFSYRLLKGFAFKLSAKRADLLCTVSEYSKAQIEQHYKIKSSDILITPNAVSEDFFEINEPKPASLPDKYILYVSRIEPRKNHIAIVKAYNRLKLSNKGYQLVFIGKETVSTPQLHDALSDLEQDVRSKIQLIPQASFADLKLWYKYANIFIYPSIAEGFGIPPIEAGAAKVNVICNRATAMSDFKFFGDALIDIDDEKLFDRTIIRLLENSDKEQLDSISEKIRQSYNWNTIANEFDKSLDRFR